jgi:lipoprotein-anchoring transpeptidase ErfK/SrfK
MEENKMVKSKKMSKTGIAVIVLALLLVLSMVMGLTGAWFTASKSESTSSTISLKFGKVAVDLNVSSSVANAASTSEAPAYKLVAGSSITTSISITNASTVDMYYVVMKGGSPYVVDETNKILVAATASNLQRIAPSKSTIGFSTTYTVVDTANDGKKAFYYGDNQYVTVEFDTAIGGDFLNALVTGTYEVRAIQADNLNSSGEAADALQKLTTDWATVSVGADAPAPVVQP